MAPMFQEVALQIPRVMGRLGQNPGIAASPVALCNKNLVAFLRSYVRVLYLVTHLFKIIKLLVVVCYLVFLVLLFRYQ